MIDTQITYDVVIVGGGPAGLSAALVLGRCRRRVLLCDAGQPRNAASAHLHGYLTRDGINPREFLRLGRSELAQYDTVEVRDVHVTDARCESSRFSTTLATGETVCSRKLLLATGVVDNVPAIEGLRELYGKSIFHCPYCDGWELREQPMVVYGRGERGYGLSLELTGWTRDMVLLTDGPCELDEDQRERLEREWPRLAEALAGPPRVNLSALTGRSVDKLYERCSSRPARSSVRSLPCRSAASSTTREP
jgi:thioredoxin reductase